MKRELDHLARFPGAPGAVAYKKEIASAAGAPGCINFIRSNGLEGHIKLNIETNHATLAGHTVGHELTYAAAHGFLGSIDANTGGKKGSGVFDRNGPEGASHQRLPTPF